MNFSNKRPKIFCPNPRIYKSKFKPQEIESFGQFPSELKTTSSSTLLKCLEEIKSSNDSCGDSQREDVYKTPTMKPKSSTYKQILQSTKTEKQTTPSLFEYYSNLAELSAVESEKTRFSTEYDILEVLLINKNSFIL